VPSPPQPEVAATPSVAKPDADSKDSALQEYLATGKQLPDYITTTGASQPASAEPPAQASVTPTAPDAATAAPESPIAAPAVADAATALPVPAAEARPPEAMAAVPPPAPVPLPVTARPKPAPVVGEAELKGWKSGTLEDYLKQQGLLTDGGAAQGGN